MRNRSRKETTSRGVSKGTNCIEYTSIRNFVKIWNYGVFFVVFLLDLWSWGPGNTGPIRAENSAILLKTGRDWPKKISLIKAAERNIQCKTMDRYHLQCILSLYLCLPSEPPTYCIHSWRKRTAIIAWRNQLISAIPVAQTLGGPLLDCLPSGVPVPVHAGKQLTTTYSVPVNFNILYYRETGFIPVSRSPCFKYRYQCF
jgi:hypothetical protein